MFQAFSSLLHANACVLEKDICLSQIDVSILLTLIEKRCERFGDKD